MRITGLRKWGVLGLITLMYIQATAQVQLYKKDDQYLIVLPSMSYSQETSLSGGLSGLFALKTDTFAITRQSYLALGGTYSLLNQKNLVVYSNIWGKQNNTHIIAGFDYSDFPYNFYGIGNSTLASDLNKIKDVNSRLHFSFDKRVGKVFYLGTENNFYSNRIQDLDTNGVFAQSSFFGKQESKMLLTGIALIYDTRDNANYATKGNFIRFSGAYGPKLGANFYQASRLQLQTRTFFNLKKDDSRFTHVLGIHSLSNFMIGDSIPFSQLAVIGGNDIMRGYYRGRFRDNYATALQVEYKYRPFTKWVLAGFVGTGCVFNQFNQLIPNLKPNYGFGIRFFADVESRLSFRVDYGIGEKNPNEKRIQGLIIGVTEAF
jgi:hypothetical protein